MAIAGGGLAGLALSIQLARAGHRVIVFEKEQYPFHKVCGEYISLESWNFLVSLGLDLENMHLPMIRKLQLSSLNGRLVEATLPLGGFGISRFVLDHRLAQIAINTGAMIAEGTRVNDVAETGAEFTLATSQQVCRARLVCGSFGKRSHIDIKWKRPFTQSARTRLNNYIGVKYHVKTDFPADTIALHHFDGGYCGIVSIGVNQYNLCYLTTAANLQKSDNSIERMEQTVLAKNPHLKKLFASCEFITGEPSTISQISFERKSQVERHVLMLGDAAGMIAPLCGNGMSMALHSSKLAFGQVDRYLSGRIGRQEMEEQYTREWQRHFSKRLALGRNIQSLTGQSFLTNAFIGLLQMFPGLVPAIVRRTHGTSF